MKVLWFEIAIPSKYENTGRVVTGWQDALESVVCRCPDIELFIAFESDKHAEVKEIDGVTYIPMQTSYSFIERKKSDFTWKINEKKVVSNGQAVIKQYAPDIIHVFGNEWPYGLLAQYTDIPLVVHIQGSIIPYDNALYPPRYNGFTMVRGTGINIRKQYHHLQASFKAKSRVRMERRVWKVVSHYMGRTNWDRALVNMLHPSATYHHVEEALRPVFWETKRKWEVPTNGRKIKLFTIGCSSFWKGIDMMLKTASVLKDVGIEFEWSVAGKMSEELKEIVEKTERLKFSDCNIRILGFLPPEKMVDYLCEATMYVHTAYIENSPNSICEAQILGVPVISTMVGGIASLVHDGIDGELFPANDPWQMANGIVGLSKDLEKLKRYSENARSVALKRHSAENILSELLTCYNDILRMTSDEKGN